MADKTLRRMDSEMNWPYQKMRDLGDGSFALSVTDEGVASNKVTTTSLTHGTLTTLVTNVNSYLAGSTKRCLNVIYMNDGLVSLNFYSLIIEVTV